MTAEYKNWQEDFVDINFTDQRLKSRFFKIIDAFAASPGKSTWAATGSRSSAKAAYRFFSNSEISKDELLDSISRATVEKIKCADAEWILAVQDTTAVGFGDRKAIQGMVATTRVMLVAPHRLLRVAVAAAAHRVAAAKRAAAPALEVILLKSLIKI